MNGNITERHRFSQLCISAVALCTDTDFVLYSSTVIHFLLSLALSVSLSHPHPPHTHTFLGKLYTVHGV